MADHATDVRTRTTDLQIISGHPTSPITSPLLGLVAATLAQTGIPPLRGVISDSGSEFKGEFTTRVTALGLAHERIPPRSLNAVVERFHQTILERCWRSAFHRRFYTTVQQLQTQANAGWSATTTDPTTATG